MTEAQNRDDLIARIVAAFAARTDTSIDDIVSLTMRLQQEMGTTPAPAPEHRVEPTGEVETPALPISQAVTRDTVFCLCCGKGFKMLKRHLGAEHDMTEDEYRARFGLPADMPLVAPSYSNRKAEYAKQTGLGKYNRSDNQPDTSRGADAT